MCNAAIKTLTAGIIVMMAACSSDGNDASKASQLLEEARQLCRAGDIDNAVKMLDSLDRTYPRQIDIRRRSLNVRAMVKERETVRDLQATDSLTAVLSVAVDSLKGQLEWVANQVEGYYAAAGSSLPPTGIEGRINPDGVFYVISSLTGHKIDHTSITLSSGSEQASSAIVVRDGERNRVDNSTEIVHYVGEESDTLGRFAVAHAGMPLTLTFNGNSTYSRPLTMGEQKQLIAVYEYASTLTRLRVAALEHERLERQLVTARSQVARTMPDSVEAQ